MVGRIRFTWAGEELTAELSDDLTWSCDHPTYGRQLARWLQGVFDPRDGLSPSRGRPGCRALDDAATWLGGTIGGLSEPEGTDDERIY